MLAGYLQFVEEVLIKGTPKSVLRIKLPIDSVNLETKKVNTVYNSKDFIHGASTIGPK